MNTLDQADCKLTGGVFFPDRQCLADGVAEPVPWLCLDCIQLTEELFWLGGSANCVPVGSWGGEGRCRDGCKEIRMSWSGFGVSVDDPAPGPACGQAVCNATGSPACPCDGCSFTGSTTIDAPLVETADDEVCCALRAGGNDPAYASFGTCVGGSGPSIIWQCDPPSGLVDYPCRPKALAICTLPTADTPVGDPLDATCCQVPLGGYDVTFTLDLNDPQGSCTVIEGTYTYDSVTGVEPVGNLLGWPAGGVLPDVTPGTFAVSLIA